MKKRNFLRGIHIATFFSFIFIVVFFSLFIIYAPGNYDIDSCKFDLGNKIIDIAFAILILNNGICILLSFASALSMLYKTIQIRMVNKVQILDIALSLYPVMIVLVLGKGDISLLIEYFTSPLRIFGII